MLRITIGESATARGLILFDKDHSCDERILAEQFRY